MESKVKVPVSIVLAYVNRSIDGADPKWIKRLWPHRKALTTRFAHLKNLRAETFPPGSYILVPEYWC